MKKLILFIPLAFVLFLSGWWFFWPLIECSYAISWTPLFNPIHKFFLFLIGGGIFWPVLIGTGKMLVV